MESEWKNRESKKLKSLISKYEQKECVNRKQEKHNDRRIRKAKNRLLKIDELCQLEHSQLQIVKLDNDQKKELIEEKKKLEAQIHHQQKENKNLHLMLHDKSKTFFEEKTFKDLKSQLRDQRAKYRQLFIDYINLKKGFGRSSEENIEDSGDSTVVQIELSKQLNRQGNQNEGNKKTHSSSTFGSKCNSKLQKKNLVDCP